MKGHMGLADLLLEQPSVDINFRLDTGMTLVAVACSSQLVDDIVSQLEYLVVKKKADCTLVNADNANAVSAIGRSFSFAASTVATLRRLRRVPPLGLSLRWTC